jgi:hypothetical protein
MTLPSLLVQIADPGRGVVNVNDAPPVVFGQILGGSDDASKLQSYNDLDEIRTRVGFGTYAEDLAKMLTEAGGPIFGVGLSAVGIAGANTAVTRVGSGPDCTYSGTCRETYSGKVEITESGDRGVARFRYTLDDHARDEDVLTPTWSEEYTVPVGGTFAMGDSGLTWTFPDAPFTSAVTESDPQSADTLTLTGTPVGDYDFVFEITTAGDRSGAVFKWSSDGGENYTTGVNMAATNSLGATGITANWSAGAGGAGNDYSLGTVFTAHTATEYSEGDVYTFETKPGRFNAANVTSATGVVQSQATSEPDIWVLSGSYDTDEEGSAVAAALGTALDLFATGNRFAGGFTDVGSGDVVADVVAEASEWSNRRVCGSYGFHYVQSALPYEGFTTRKVAANISLASRGSRVLISTDLARVAEGALGGVLGITFDGNDDPSIDDAKISCLRTWPGQPGFFVGKARLKSSNGSDFTDWHFLRVMNRACRIARDSMIQFQGEGFRTVSGGTLDPRDAADIKAIVDDALAAGLLRPDNARGVPGHVSAVSITVDLAEPIVSSGKLKIKLRLRPLGYADDIVINVGFTTV